MAPMIGPTKGSGTATTAPMAAATAVRFTTGLSNILFTPSLCVIKLTQSGSLGATRLLARLPPLAALGFLGERIERLAADVQGQVPHRIAPLGAGLVHFVELVAGFAGELSRLVRILERARHPDQRRGHDVGDQRVLGQRFQTLGGLAGRAFGFLLALLAL